MYFNNESSDTEKLDSSASFTATGSGTVMYWCWTNSITKANQRIVGRCTNYESRITLDDMRHEYYQDAVPTADNVVETDYWHHWAFTWDGTNWKWYVNGVLETTHPRTQKPMLDGTSGDLEIGHHYNINDFDGGIDEYQVFNTSLPQQAISELYYGSANIKDPSPLQPLDLVEFIILDIVAVVIGIGIAMGFELIKAMRKK